MSSYGPTIDKKEEQMLVWVWGKRDPYTLWGVSISTAILEIGFEVSQKLEIELPDDPDRTFLPQLEELYILRQRCLHIYVPYHSIQYSWTIKSA